MCWSRIRQWFMGKKAVVSDEELGQPIQKRIVRILPNFPKFIRCPGKVNGQVHNKMLRRVVKGVERGKNIPAATYRCQRCDLNLVLRLKG